MVEAQIKEKREKSSLNISSLKTIFLKCKKTYGTFWTTIPRFFIFMCTPPWKWKCEKKWAFEASLIKFSHSRYFTPGFVISTGFCCYFSLGFVRRLKFSSCRIKSLILYGQREFCVQAALRAYTRSALRTSPGIMRMIPRRHYARPPPIGTHGHMCQGEHTQARRAQGSAARLSAGARRATKRTYAQINAEHSPEGASAG